MPYNNSNQLPEYVKKLSAKTKSKWMSIFNEVYKAEGEKMAFAVANTWLKKHVKKKEVAPKTENIRSIVKFEVDFTKELISKTEDGSEYISAVLSDNLTDSVGDKIPDSILEKWAKQINSDMPVGDIDHTKFEQLVQANVSEDTIKKELRNKKGIARAVKALVKDGRLWVQLLVDKRYRKVVRDAKGLSIEAALSRNPSTNEIVDGDLFGFTFGIHNNPVNPRATVI